ncbi:hypothetical protein EIP86_007395 [Pleurotus ostreatoroseus]|nr:hypothetical protein EIP86_007395 [Pleurotus ostreatoroseus]
MHPIVPTAAAVTPPPLKLAAKRCPGWTADENTWLNAIFVERHDEIIAIPRSKGKGTGRLRKLADQMLIDMPEDVKGRMVNESEAEFADRKAKRSQRLQTRLSNYRKEHCGQQPTQQTDQVPPPPAPIATVQVTLPSTGLAPDNTTTVQYSVPKLRTGKPRKVSGKALYVRLQGVMRSLQSAQTEHSNASTPPHEPSTPPQGPASSLDSATLPDFAIAGPLSSPDATGVEGSVLPQDPKTSGAFKVNPWRLEKLAEYDTLPEAARKELEETAELINNELFSLYKLKGRPDAKQRAALITEIPRVLKEMWREQAQYTNFSGLTITGGAFANSEIQFYMYPAGTNAHNQNLMAHICERAKWTWAEFQLILSEWFLSVAGDQKVGPQLAVSPIPGVATSGCDVVEDGAPIPDPDATHCPVHMDDSPCLSDDRDRVQNLLPVDTGIAEEPVERGSDAAMLHAGATCPPSVADGSLHLEDGAPIPDPDATHCPVRMDDSPCLSDDRDLVQNLLPVDTGIAEEPVERGSDAAMLHAGATCPPSVADGSLHLTHDHHKIPSPTSTTVAFETAMPSTLDLVGSVTGTREPRDSPSSAAPFPAATDPIATDPVVSCGTSQADQQVPQSIVTPRIVPSVPSPGALPTEATLAPRLEYVMAMERVQRDAKRERSRQAGLKGNETKLRQAAEAAKARAAAEVSAAVAEEHAMARHVSTDEDSGAMDVDAVVSPLEMDVDMDLSDGADAVAAAEERPTRSMSIARQQAAAKKAAAKELRRQRGLKAAETRKKNRAVQVSHVPVGRHEPAPSDVPTSSQATSAPPSSTARYNVGGRQRRLPERYNTETQPYKQK